MENRNNAIIALLASAGAYLLLDSEKDDSEEEFQNSQKKKKPKIQEQCMENEIDQGNLGLMHKEVNKVETTYRNSGMNESCFNEILSYIKEDITKRDTAFGPAVSAEEKLAVTLKFLATGDSFYCLEYQTTFSDSFISSAVIEVCEAICKRMESCYLKFPESKEEWKKISDEFSLHWQFPLCLGTLDGKQIKFKASKKDAFLYRKDGYDSMVLLTLSDAYSMFTFIDIGLNSPESDIGRLAVIEKAKKNFPEEAIIGNNRMLPYVVIGDNNFPLQKHVMKPYPAHTKVFSEQIFNKRLNHARGSGEHSFGIISDRFGILDTTINQSAFKVKTIIKTCCVLHNFLIRKSDWYGAANSSIENFTEYQQRSSQKARIVRDTFAEYFCYEGRAKIEK